MSRVGGRGFDAVRAISITRRASKYAEGSALIAVGDTRVLCTATVEERVPPFLRGQGQGWVSAEYSMLPRATDRRGAREVMRGRQGGRSMEIQRLIGRALRAAVDLVALGERTILLDCDVLQADGGTRCAAICGGYVALADAVGWLEEHGLLEEKGGAPLVRAVGAVSVGVVEGVALVDLDYAEDSRAGVDLNVVMAEGGELIEVQGTNEEGAGTAGEAVFTRGRLGEMLELAEGAMGEVFRVQREALDGDGGGGG